MGRKPHVAVLMIHINQSIWLTALSAHAHLFRLPAMMVEVIVIAESSQGK